VTARAAVSWAHDALTDPHLRCLLARAVALAEREADAAVLGLIAEVDAEHRLHGVAYAGAVLEAAGRAAAPRHGARGRRRHAEVAVVGGGAIHVRDAHAQLLGDHAHRLRRDVAEAVLHPVQGFE
jgi:hypothetical protein